MEEVDAIEREATEEESLIDWKSMSSLFFSGYPG